VKDSWLLQGTVRREEIEAIHRAGPDAVAVLFAGQAERIAALEAELQEL
jgi:hypothetical protein